MKMFIFQNNLAIFKRLFAKKNLIWPLGSRICTNSSFRLMHFECILFLELCNPICYVLLIHISSFRKQKQKLEGKGKNNNFWSSVHSRDYFFPILFLDCTCCKPDILTSKDFQSSLSLLVGSSPVGEMMTTFALAVVNSWRGISFPSVTRFQR